MTTPNGTTQPLVKVGAPTIQTLSVTVHALRIGPKQVTQSVFRQLPAQQIWDLSSGRLQGTPWGHVNYYWGDCKDDHLHVVWDDGEQLFRDCVYEPHYRLPTGLTRFSDQEQRLADLLTRAAAYAYGVHLINAPTPLDAMASPLEIAWPCGVKRVFSWTTSVPFLHHETVGWTVYRLHQRYAEGPEPQAVEYYVHELRQKIPLEAQKVWKLTSTPASFKAACKALDPVARTWQKAHLEVERLEQRFLPAYEQIAALPQLFIAV